VGRLRRGEQRVELTSNNKNAKGGESYRGGGKWVGGTVLCRSDKGAKIAPFTNWRGTGLKSKKYTKLWGLACLGKGEERILITGRTGDLASRRGGGNCNLSRGKRFAFDEKKKKGWKDDTKG